MAPVCCCLRGRGGIWTLLGRVLLVLAMVFGWSVAGAGGCVLHRVLKFG